MAEAAVAVRSTPPIDPAPTGRESGSLPNPGSRRRYRLVLGVLTLLALGFGFGLLAWGNPLPFGTPGFWRVAELRGTTVAVMLLVAFCQAVATVSFQTVTNNRIITPSIMGFEALYVAVQTTAVYLYGVPGITALTGLPQFVAQVVVMVGLSVALFGWLLSGRHGNIQVMLLIGIVVGGGLGSIASFMRRLLAPSEFDVLTARMFGSMSMAQLEYLPVAIPLCVVTGGLLWFGAKRLNVVALGRDTTMNLGINHRREVMKVLLLVSILMAVSTALVGPMTFLGFLVATLAYQFAGTYDHRLIFPVAVLTGFVTLSGAYFVMQHVFYAEGLVSIIIELVGGSLFLFVILRKGRL